MKLFELLLESRVDFLRDKYGKLYEKQKIISIINDVIDLDPTNNKKYTQWLLEKFYSLSFNKRDFFRYFSEDAYKWKEYLSIYDKVKPKLDQNLRDINKLSLEQLKDIALQYKEKEEEILTKNDYLDKKYKINETNQYLVYMFKTATKQDFKMYQLVSTNTEWCTRPDYDTFKYYINKFPLFIFINKQNRSEKYQFHQMFNQFMDAADKNINSQLKIKLIPLISNYLPNNILFKVYILEPLELKGHHGFINKKGELVVEGLVNADEFNNSGNTWVALPSGNFCYMTRNLKFMTLGGTEPLSMNDPHLKGVKIYPENLIE